MKNFNRGISKLCLDTVCDALKGIDEETAIHVLDMNIKNNPPIYIHKIKERKSRDNFYQSLMEHFRKIGFTRCLSFIAEKLYTILISENLFDKISDTLKQCDIERLSAEQQCWSHIVRAEREMAAVIKEVNDLCEKRIVDGVLPSKLILYNENNISYSPDAALNQMVVSLSLALKMLCYKNNWIENNLFCCPVRQDVHDQEVYQAGATQLLAWVWGSLEDNVNRCLKFGGALRQVPAAELHTIENSGSIKELFYFDREITMDEKYDLIANERLINKLYQNTLEIAYEIKKKDNSIHISEELIALISIEDTLKMDILEDECLYHGLTLSEWVKSYSAMKLLVENNNDGSNEGIILSDVELSKVMRESGIASDRVCKAVEHLTFNKKSKDLFDTPLIKLADDNYYLFKQAIPSLNIGNVVFSQLSTLGTQFDKKGKNFEETVVNFINKKGHCCKSFKFKRGNEEYEFDAVFIMDDKVFVVECKNTSLSYRNVTQAYRYSKFISDSVSQIKRLVDGLNKYPGVFNNHFGKNLADYQVVPLIMNCLPYARKGKIEGVFVTDFSSFCKFFNDNAVNAIVYSKEITKTPIHKLWSGDRPTSIEFINYLNDPIQVKELWQYLKVIPRYHPVNNETGFFTNDVEIDNESISNQELSVYSEITV